MNICLDNIIFSLQQAGGISVYWTEIWSRLLKENISAYAIEDKKSKSNIFRSYLDISEKFIIKEKLPTKISRYLKATLPLEKIDIFHSSYYRPCNRNIPTIHTCYDFTYEYYRKGPSRLVHSLHKKKALTSAHGIICISESTKRDLMKFFPKIDEDKISVIHLGVSEAFKPIKKVDAQLLVRDKINLHKPFCLFVGDRNGYKNFLSAVHAIKACKGHILVIVGGGKLKAKELNKLNELIPDKWIHLDKLSSDLLNALYNLAHALIYPSSYEGFGIPVIEAMSSRCPVIAINSSSIPEVSGSAAILIDKPDYENIAHYIIALEDDFLREEMVLKGLDNVRRFTWDDCYIKTKNFYKKIYLTNK